jgi:hypothetical protein
MLGHTERGGSRRWWGSGSGLCGIGAREGKRGLGGSGGGGEREEEVRREVGGKVGLAGLGFSFGGARERRGRGMARVWGKRGGGCGGGGMGEIGFEG